MRQSRSVILKTQILRLAVCAALLSALLASCAKPDPKMITVVDPVEVKQLALEGRLVASHKGKGISPDGKFLLAALMGDESDSMVAIPITEDGETVFFYSMDASWTHNNLVQWYPIGWLSNTECLFIVHGWQDQGPHRGKRGTSIFVGNTETGTSSLLAYSDVPTQGEIVDEAVLTPEGKVYIRVSQKFWEFDVSSKNLRLLRDDFPSYFGLFHVAVSPTADHVMYSSLDRDDKSGIYVMDVASGIERPLLPIGDSLSFYPSWSPDGKYVAAYTARRADSPVIEGATIYNLIPGEDGPLPAAQAITILDAAGNIRRTITVEDQFLSHMAWLADGKSLVFLSGPVTFGKWGEVQDMEYSEAWIVDITEGAAPLRVADISAIEKETLQPTSYIYPVASLPDATGALLTIASTEATAVWRVSTTGSPVKIADGWWETARLTPNYKDSVVGLISDGVTSNLWLVAPQSVTQFGHPLPAGTGIAAYSEDLLILESRDFVSNRTQVVVYRMLSEREEE